MKKDRNCGANMYPVYPMMQPQMMPQMVMPGMNTMQPQMMPNQMQQMPNQIYSSGSLEQQVNNMANQVNNLERRVSNLENNNHFMRPIPIANTNPPIVPNIISNNVSFFILFSSIYQFFIFLC